LGRETRARFHGAARGVAELNGSGYVRSRDAPGTSGAPLVLDEGVAKDRARPFSRKHRRYWIPVTGGMVLIGVINVIIGFWSYNRPSDVHERIVPDVPFARGSGRASAPAHAATGCAPPIVSRIEREM